MSTDRATSTAAKSKSTTRARLINLRSRKSQNLTQDSDYLSVLNSLKVKRNAEETHQPSQETSPLSLTTTTTTTGELDNTKPLTINSGLNLEIIESNPGCSFNSISSPPQPSQSSSCLPTTSTASEKTRDSLKNLSSLKRKIEQNDDFYETNKRSVTAAATAEAMTTIDSDESSSDNVCGGGGGDEIGFKSNATENKKKKDANKERKTRNYRNSSS